MLRSNKLSWSKLEESFLEQQRELERVRAQHAETVTELANAKLQLAELAFDEGVQLAAARQVVYM